MITVEEQADVAAFANYSLDSSASPSTSSSPVAAAPTPAPAAKESPVPAPVPAAASASSPAVAQQQTSNGRAVASPFARKLLRDAGLPASALLGMTGSGAGGRIVSADVIAAIAVGMPAAAPQSASTAASAPVHVSAAQAQVSNIPGIYSDFELSDIARAVAARHTASMQQVPHYYLSVELNLSKLLELRESLNDSKSKGADLSVLDFFVKASALAVAQVQRKALSL
jgi:pyruvate dehydrogenase E2 component (dihydrolipoamide acetyltransferase)